MKLGIIGCGNMACAMMGGMIKGGAVSCNDIYASDAYPPAMAKAKEQYNINIIEKNSDVAQLCDIILLVVKPNKSKEVMKEIAPFVKQSTVVSAMAGVTLFTMEAFLGGSAKLIRTMPNTPALVGEGMTAICRNENVTDAILEQVIKLLSAFSRVEQVEEKLMDTVVAIGGASPAYAFMFIEAMADAAVAGGMARATAYTFAAQALLGSAKMVLDTGLHPGVLKDMVCSPGGATIEAVKVLEENGFRNAVMKAVKASADKSAQLNP